MGWKNGRDDDRWVLVSFGRSSSERGGPFGRMSRVRARFFGRSLRMTIPPGSRNDTTTDRWMGLPEAPVRVGSVNQRTTTARLAAARFMRRRGGVVHVLTTARPAEGLVRHS